MIGLYIALGALAAFTLTFMIMAAHYSNEVIELARKLHDVKVAYMFAQVRCKDVVSKMNVNGNKDYENKEMKIIINTLMENLEKALNVNKD